MIAETPDTLSQKRGIGLEPLTKGMFGYSLIRPSLNQEFFNEIYDGCHEYGIPIEGFHTETGNASREPRLDASPASAFCFHRTGSPRSSPAV